MKNIKKYKYSTKTVVSSDAKLTYLKNLKIYLNEETRQYFGWDDTYGFYRELTEKYVEALKAA